MDNIQVLSWTVAGPHARHRPPAGRACVAVQRSL